MTEVKDLDIKTLEYVMSIVACEIVDSENCKYQYSVRQKLYTYYDGKADAAYDINNMLRTLIREQQESNDS